MWTSDLVRAGDGYSDDWAKEAKRRGLPNLHDTMESLAPLKDERNIALFEKYGGLSRGEMLSRWEIGMEDYHRQAKGDGLKVLVLDVSCLNLNYLKIDNLVLNDRGCF